MTEQRSVEEMDVLELILALHERDGTKPIGQLPGLWYRKVDERWEFWVNGHFDGPRKMDDGVNINPGDCFLQFNGWPAGIFSLINGDGVIAAGAIANYETFRQALQGAVAAL